MNKEGGAVQFDKGEGGLTVADEDCNLSDGEEEKSLANGSQKKAYLSIDKILDKIKERNELDRSRTMTIVKTSHELKNDIFG